MLTPINPPGTKWPGLSQAMKIEGKGMFVSGGHCGLDAAGEPVEGMQAQVEAMFEGLKRTLAEAGLGFEHVARTTCFVRDFSPELTGAIKAVRARHYNMDCPPASVMVQAGLYDPRLWAEIEVIAVLP
ncbi:RidA family protein [Albidovulum sp.]|uniref:RidA family protein n=1 Tax=Albidovulum sp. TaxID=1872424 RepID=UPI0039B99975